MYDYNVINVVIKLDTVRFMNTRNCIGLKTIYIHFSLIFNEPLLHLINIRLKKCIILSGLYDMKHF